MLILEIIWTQKVMDITVSIFLSDCMTEALCAPISEAIEPMSEAIEAWLYARDVVFLRYIVIELAFAQPPWNTQLYVCEYCFDESR